MGSSIKNDVGLVLTHQKLEEKRKNHNALKTQNSLKTARLRNRRQNRSNISLKRLYECW